MRNMSMPKVGPAVWLLGKFRSSWALSFMIRQWGTERELQTLLENLYSQQYFQSWIYTEAVKHLWWVNQSVLKTWHCRFHAYMALQKKKMQPLFPLTCLLALNKCKRWSRWKCPGCSTLQICSLSKFGWLGLQMQNFLFIFGKYNSVICRVTHSSTQCT